MLAVIDDREGEPALEVDACEAVRRKAARAASDRGEQVDSAVDDRESGTGRREVAVVDRWVKAEQRRDRSAAAGGGWQTHHANGRTRDTDAT